MPKNKVTPKKTSDSPPISAPAGEPRGHDHGAAALLAVRDELLAMPREQVSPPRGFDVGAAATFVLGLCKKLSQKHLAERFLSLPARELDRRDFEHLADYAWAARHCHLQLTAARAQTSKAKAPPDLVKRATAVRQRMFDLCDYHFRGDTPQARMVRAIRAGQGLADLADDLARLADLYDQEHAQVARDPVHYRPGDRDEARALAAELLDALGETPHRREAKAGEVDRDLYERAASRLQRAYDEVAAAGRFLLRHAGGAEMFPSLLTAARAPARRKKGKPAESPASADAQPPADHPPMP